MYSFCSCKSYQEKDGEYYLADIVEVFTLKFLQVKCDRDIVKIYCNKMNIVIPTEFLCCNDTGEKYFYFIHVEYGGNELDDISVEIPAFKVFGDFSNMNF